jgi:hypothetical protein
VKQVANCAHNEAMRAWTEKEKACSAVYRVAKEWGGGRIP